MITSLDEGASGGGSAKGLSPVSTGSPTTPAQGRPGRLNNEAFARFRAADTRGSSSPSSSSLGVPSSPGGGGPLSPGAGGNTELFTVHQNTITSIRPFTNNGVQGEGGVVESVSTSGLDGRLVIWGVPHGVAGLTGKVGGMHLR